MTGEPIAIGAVGDVSTSSLLWRYGGQLHLSVAVRARFVMVDNGFAERAPVAGPSALSPSDDLVPYRQGCDVWMVGSCHAKPLSDTAPVNTHVRLIGGHEQLMNKQHRLMLGSDLGAAGYGPLRTTRWLGELTEDGVVEIPRNFDWTKLHAAPPSQRIRFLEGGERLNVEGVVEGKPKMRCRIPKARGEARIWGRGSNPSEPGSAIHLVADTLGIDSDSASLTIVWRGSFPIDDREAVSRMLIAAAVAEETPIDWREGWILANVGKLPDAAVRAGTLDLDVGATHSGPAMPFNPARESQPAGEALRPATLEGAPWSERTPSTDPLPQQLVAQPGPIPTQPLPAQKPLPARRMRAMTLELEDAVSADGPAQTAPALPFRPPGSTPAGPTEAMPESQSPLAASRSRADESMPVSITEPAFEISSMDTVETAPPQTETAATPFENDDE